MNKINYTLITLAITGIFLLLILISGAYAQVQSLIHGQTIYTFYGTEQCPKGWNLVQQGYVGTQYFSGPEYFGGNTLCIDSDLDYDIKYTNNEPNRTELIQPPNNYWASGDKRYSDLTCVVCEKSWAIGN